MRFDCDKKHQRLTNWHRWFAWYPVCVGPNDCRWLEYVERKGEYHFDISDVFAGCGGGYWWEYRLQVSAETL